jgi:DNA-binding MarR family transcriptional regulator
MAEKLKAEIQQRKPFAGREAEVYLNLLRTAEALSQDAERVLKPYGLTGTQYNVLRILRGAGPDGLACGEVSGRMVTHDPDITRLLDRLEARGLVARAREKRDRRVITTRITPAGLDLLKELDGPVSAWHRRALGHLGSQRLRALIDLLEAARGTLG